MRLNKNNITLQDIFWLPKKLIYLILWKKLSKHEQFGRQNVGKKIVGEHLWTGKSTSGNVVEKLMFSFWYPLQQSVSSSLFWGAVISLSHLIFLENMDVGWNYIIEFYLSFGSVHSINLQGDIWVLKVETLLGFWSTSCAERARTWCLFYLFSIHYDPHKASLQKPLISQGNSWKT